MKRLLIILISYFVLISCKDKNETVNDLILQEVSESYDTSLIYVIQSKNLLYVIKTEPYNLLAFMLNFEISGCSTKNNVTILYIKGVNVNLDLTSFYDIENLDCIDFINSPLYLKSLEKIYGSIYLVEKENKFILKKKGNILLDIKNDKNLKVEYIKINDPHL